MLEKDGKGEAEGEIGETDMDSLFEDVHGGNRHGDAAVAKKYRLAQLKQLEMSGDRDAAIAVAKMDKDLQKSIQDSLEADTLMSAQTNRWDDGEKEPIRSNNKGFQLLLKFGWKQGNGFGKKANGIDKA